MQLTSWQAHRRDHAAIAVAKLPSCGTPKPHRFAMGEAEASVETKGPSRGSSTRPQQQTTPRAPIARRQRHRLCALRRPHPAARCLMSGACAASPDSHAPGRRQRGRTCYANSRPPRLLRQRAPSRRVAGSGRASARGRLPGRGAVRQRECAGKHGRRVTGSGPKSGARVVRSLSPRCARRARNCSTNLGAADRLGTRNIVILAIISAGGTKFHPSLVRSHFGSSRRISG